MDSNLQLCTLTMLLFFGTNLLLSVFLHFLKPSVTTEYEINGNGNENSIEDDKITSTKKFLVSHRAFSG